MARIQRTHHPIFQGSLESAACLVTDHASVADAAPVQPEAAPQPEPSDNVSTLAALTCKHSCNS